MTTNHQSRSLLFGSTVMLALTLLAPAAVMAEDDVAALAPVAAPAEEATSADEVRSANRVLAAQHALLSGDIGSMQEERLLAIVVAGPSWDESSGYGAVEASHATIGHPPISTSQANYALAAQRALQSNDLGSLQEEALLAVVAAGMAEDELNDDNALAASCAELLAKFRAFELSLSPSLGAEQRGMSTCDVVG
jgi:hypothetical protein